MFVPVAAVMRSSRVPGFEISGTYMRHTLTADTVDSYRGVTHPAGTRVVAPLRLADPFEVPGAVTWKLGSGADDPPQTIDGMAWVFCCHDVKALADTGTALFYIEEDLMQLYASEPTMAIDAFDPITYGTGEAALAWHSLSNMPVLAIEATRDRFWRSRGTIAPVIGAFMGSFRGPAGGVVQAVSTTGSISTAIMFAKKIELECVRMRVQTELTNLPADDRGNASLLAGDADALPVGRPHGLCCAPAIVQSPAVWSVRRDWRVAKFFGDPFDLNIPLDLPLIMYTGRSQRDNFMRGDRPFIIEFGSTPTYGSVKRTGAVNIGNTTMGVWTLVADQSIPLSFYEASINHHPCTFQVPIAVELNGGPRREIRTRKQFYDFFGEVTVRSADAIFHYRDGTQLSLHYESCAPGQMYRINDLSRPQVDLPPLVSIRDTDLVIAIPVALMPHNYPAVKEDIWRRMHNGQCMRHDLRFQDISATPSEEAHRLWSRLPKSAPYRLLPSDPWQWDPRNQNPFYAMPYISAHQSSKFMSDLRS